jgi:ribonuclease BN (tRNA processing enzyme)
MRFACLGSGSRGNALVVEKDRTRLMLDCGYPVRETERRLAAGSGAGRSRAFITHEHSDHMPGLQVRARRSFGLDDPRTLGFAACLQINLLTATAVSVSAAVVAVSHDEREPAHLYSPTAHRLGVLTDTGVHQPYRGDVSAATPGAECTTTPAC